MAQGVKETIELLKGLEVVAGIVAKIGADGRVNAVDLKTLLDLVSKADVLVEAVKGLDKVTYELKDLDSAEIMLLVEEVRKLAVNVKDAYLASK